MPYKGWVKLHRRFKDNFLWTEKRTFSKFEAWLDLFSEANHKDGSFIFEGYPFAVKRGQWVTSQFKLAKRWNWSRGKVLRFLQILTDDEMVSIQVMGMKASKITILNYEAYQRSRTTDGTNGSTTDGHKQEDKKGKNEKNKDSGVFQKSKDEEPGKNRAAHQGEFQTIKEIVQKSIN